MLLMIDNYDSFTWNVVQYLGELKADVKVIRNDELTVDEIIALAPERIVISPGPCTPTEAGVSLEIITRLAGKLPILGVCLGHQSIGQAMGGKVVRARQVMHGKISPIHHNNQGVFAGLPSPFNATRYHSLVIEKESLPDCLEVTAWTQHDDGSVDEIMGVRHKQFILEGVQFHPESILSEHGHSLLNNFLQMKQPQ
jgi:anthranilate synthase component 2